MFASQAEDLLLGLLKYQKAHDQKLWSRSYFTMTSKYLREAGMLPSGPGGHSAPHIDATHLANMLLALLTSEQPGHAPQAVAAYGALKTSDGGWLDTSLREFLAHAVCNPDLAALIQTMTVCRNFPRATVVLEGHEGPKTIIFVADNCPKEGGLFYVNAVLSGNFLSTLAADLADPRMKFPVGNASDELARGGWVSDDPQRHAEYKARLAAHSAEAEHDE